MAPNRQDDDMADARFRSDSCIVINGLWYVATREGLDVGPFESKAAAESAAHKIGQLLLDVDDPAAALSFLREFLRRTRA